MDGKATEAQKGALLLGIATRGETAGGDRRSRRGPARPHAPRRDPRGRRFSTPAGRAGSAATSSISRRRRRSSRRAPELPSPSTEIARSRRECGTRRRPCGVRRRAWISSQAAAGRILDEVGLVFLFAPSFHPAMKELGTVRRELGVRTIFNALGPLANPAGARAAADRRRAAGARAAARGRAGDRSARSARSFSIPPTASTSSCPAWTRKASRCATAGRGRGVSTRRRCPEQRAVDVAELRGGDAAAQCRNAPAPAGRRAGTRAARRCSGTRRSP